MIADNDFKPVGGITFLEAKRLAEERAMRKAQRSYSDEKKQN